MKFRVEQQCPQCGAPARLEETDRLFSCGFCRVKSYLVSTGIFRYYLPAREGSDRPLLYFPYWRLRGMLYSCFPQEVKHRVVDISQQARPSRIFPVSLGLRSQALTLKFVTPELEHRFVEPGRSVSAAKEEFEDRFIGEKKGSVLHQSLIGETLSLIYAPFYWDDGLHDAILGRPLDADTGVEELEGLATESPSWSIRFIPTLCPHCGWDMAGERDTLALHCENCDSLWQADHRRLTRLSALTLPGGENGTPYLPFWRIRADVSGLLLDSYADFARIANLPAVIRERWESEDFFFWVPAFRATPRAYLHLGRALTTGQPRKEPAPTVPKSGLHPVTISVSEASECLKLLLSGFMKMPPKKFKTRFPGMRVKARKYLLVYVPFEEGHHELINREYRLTVNRNMLALTGRS